MVDDVHDTCKVFAHVCFDVIWSREQFRITVVQVGGDNLVNPAFLIVFIEFLETVCEQTVSSTDEDTLCFTFLDLLGNIEHTLSGRDHIVDDDNILALYGISEEFMGNDRVFAVDNGRIITTFVEHTHINTEDVREIYCS